MSEERLNLDKFDTVGDWSKRANEIIENDENDVSRVKTQKDDRVTYTIKSDN